MYKMLVVDDEPIAVESVIFMIKRGFGDLFRIESSRSGKQAIERISDFSPDIVVMDIDMPGINGLDAIRRIKSAKGGIDFVILSAFDYFDYAQEALSLGVAEYLVKPVKETRLNEVIDRILENRKTRQSEKEHQLEQEEKLLMSIPVLEESFCAAVCAIEDRPFDWDKTCLLLGMENTGGFVMVFDFRVRNGGVLNMESYRHALKKLSGCVVNSVKGNTIVAYVFCEESSAEQKEVVTRFAEKVVREAACAGIVVHVGIGRWYDSAAQSRISYQEAAKIIKVMKSRKEAEEKFPNVLWMEDFVADENFKEESYMQYIEEYLYSCLEQGDIAAALHEYDLFVASCHKGKLDFGKIKRHIADVEVGFGRRFNIPSEVTTGYVEKMLNAQDEVALKEILCDSITNTMGTVEERNRKRADSIIEKAQKYIKEHYAESLTLEEISLAVNLSQHYFSRLFKQEMGITFTDYLSKVRIDHAKELLSMDGLSVKEIAYMAGFNDPNYFSKAFKKMTGMSPVDYRERKGVKRG